jgi:hypothetical protein
MQAGEVMKALKWQEVKEPPVLVELYATLDYAIRGVCQNIDLPHVKVNFFNVKKTNY